MTSNQNLKLSLSSGDSDFRCRDQDKLKNILNELLSFNYQYGHKLHTNNKNMFLSLRKSYLY